jgi:hypothetical protein
LIASARRQLRRVALLLGTVDLLLPLGLLAYAAASGQRYWDLFWGEGNAITWFSSVQLLVVAGAAYANHQTARLTAGVDDDARSTRAWVWGVFALGFLFLALDEEFELHETLRERVLKPGHLFGDIPFISPGDVGLWIYLAVGLAFTAFLLLELRRHRVALGLFVAALVLTASFTVIDSLPPEMELQIGFFWTSFYEESGEIWAQWLFLASFLSVLDTRLAALGGGLKPSRRGSGAGP